MEQMLANGIQLIKTNASYVFDSDTVFYRNEIPFANQSNDFDITDCFYAQPIDFTDISVLQFLTVNASVTCVVKNYLGVTLSTINGVNVGAYDNQNVFNITINWSAITGNLERCYLQITDGTEYFKSEPLKMINLKQRIKIRYRMLRNHKSIGYFFNPNNEAYEFFHIFYIEAAITEFKREIVKSVFEDSNQNLINLFGTFRHSFLLKTFQIAYYMHEKVVTLSLCDEIYLSEIRESNLYEGRIFLSKDETPAEEIIESTNLYVSSTRYVVDRAFRLVGAAQETPIVPDPNLGIVPIHHTNPNGKKATFKTPYKLLPSKTLYTPQGSPNDYLFKIGGTTDNYRNGHDVAWDSIASKTFAEFSALTVNADLHVQVRYIGSLTQTDVVATLYAPITDAPINPSTRTINPNPKTAASDLMIYPKLITGFDSVGISTGAANLFSQNRTFSELANSSDLTDYNSGIVNLPIASENGIGHLYLERTNATALTVNITTNQADPKKEIIAYCIPNNNEFYPVTGNGVNSKCWANDNINDDLRCTDTSVTNLINYPALANDAYITFQVTFRKGTNSPLVQKLINIQDSGENSFSLYIVNDTNIVLGIYGGTPGDPTTPNSMFIYTTNPIVIGSVNTITFVARKGTNAVGGIDTKLKIADCYCVINGRKIDSFVPSSVSTAVRVYDQPNGFISFATRVQNSDPRSAGGIINHAAITVSMTPPSLEFSRRYALGQQSLGQDYAWSFNAYSSPNTFNSSGVITANPAIATNHKGTLDDLFI